MGSAGIHSERGQAATGASRSSRGAERPLPGVPMLATPAPVPSPLSLLSVSSWGLSLDFPGLPHPPGPALPQRPRGTLSRGLSLACVCHQAPRQGDGSFVHFLAGDKQGQFSWEG